MNNLPKITLLTSLYRCEDFLARYFDALARLEGKEQMEVLLLHNAPTEQELAIVTQYLPHFDCIRHIIIPECEGLYRTWNRGIALAQGEYITVWNVDDVRFPKSVLQQAQALDENPQAAIAYGDIRPSDQYGVCGGTKNNSPVYSQATKKYFLREYHISCFQMWRKSIHQTIGYYDEQFKCIGDFDFQIRAALHFPFVKTDEVLGIYLAERLGKLSSNGLQPLEHNVVYPRFGIYRRLNFCLLPESNRKYQRNRMLFFDEWHDFSEQPTWDKWYKTLGFVPAGFTSAYWLCKQLAKKTLSYIYFNLNMIVKNKKINQRQKKIRDIEWNTIADTLKNFEGNFLGIGTSYAMDKAESLGFQVYGIEPYLNEHGVADPRLKKGINKIRQECAEQLPFPDRFFQVVYASHSLVHFRDMQKGLSEMLRVLDKEGLAIIVVPTGLIAFANLINQYPFLTYRQTAQFFFKASTLKKFRHIFLPNAQGSQNATIAEEFLDFKIKNWKRLVECYFKINQMIVPCLHPYPNFPRIFPYISNNNKASGSVMFICSKK
ncbi:MAG: glycosyltransferase [Candidatus Symbiothrix sp.]|jgi:ubiquinone/menaquinone biosynthesis C-methylase UbiE|nr:glycosyltransferase [Candidatus Symbiothrix sp.]